jgi:hypothetical protein
MQHSLQSYAAIPSSDPIVLILILDSPLVVEPATCATGRWRHGEIRTTCAISLYAHMRERIVDVCDRCHRPTFTGFFRGSRHLISARESRRFSPEPGVANTKSRTRKQRFHILVHSRLGLAHGVKELERRDRNAPSLPSDSRIRIRVVFLMTSARPRPVKPSIATGSYRLRRPASTVIWVRSASTFCSDIELKILPVTQRDTHPSC